MTDMDKNYLTFVAICTLAVTLFLGRYDFISVPAGGEGSTGMAFILDRWTGEIEWVSQVYRGKVTAHKPQ
ncbi:MAG: hypothetical protein RL710_849 [Pseudomonadota bacterium]|jgi:hypothetical protein